jgi:hypothetical protein
MSETDNEALPLAADVPDGGGGTKSALGADSTTPQKPVPADPPDGGGGTGG